MRIFPGASRRLTEFFILSAAMLLFLSGIALAAEKKASPKPELPFSALVQANGFLFVSGQIGTDPQSGKLAGDDIGSQTAQTLQKMKTLLEGANSGLEYVVKTTVFLKSMDDYAIMNEVYASFFPGPKPARATVEVARLVLGALIEIDAIAIPSGKKFIPAN